MSTPDSRDHADPSLACWMRHATYMARLVKDGCPPALIGAMAEVYAAEHAAGLIADLEALLDVAATWGGEGE